jgi:hypothetical protein
MVINFLMCSRTISTCYAYSHLRREIATGNPVAGPMGQDSDRLRSEYNIEATSLHQPVQ